MYGLYQHADIVAEHFANASLACLTLLLIRKEFLNPLSSLERFDGRATVKCFLPERYNRCEASFFVAWSS